ncbi:MAG: DUF362 domain-containing protein [Thermodesulfobacteriota bacterium]
MSEFVSIRHCDDYGPENLACAVRSALDDIGGLAAFVKPGDRVLLKPNLLMSAEPEKAMVTHPSFVEVVARMVIDLGAKPHIGDSPPFGNLPRVLAKSGYEPFMKRLGVESVPFKTKVCVEFTNGRLFHKMDLAREIFEFDVVVNLPKLKTHAQMLLTLAVKNLFGAVIGSDKAAWHLRAGRDNLTFATVLAQIYEKVNPKVSLIDGILAMDEDGPNAGRPRPVGIVGASADGVALDAVICRLVGFPVRDMPTCVVAAKLGLGVADEQRIEVRGDALTGFPLTDFRPPRSVSLTWNMSTRNPLRRLAKNQLVTRPDIDRTVCQRCGICRDHCPPTAIAELNGSMVIDRSKCISCFCCHELCPHGAIRIVEPLMGRLLSSITR